MSRGRVRVTCNVTSSHSHVARPLRSGHSSTTDHGEASNGGERMEGRFPKKVVDNRGIRVLRNTYLFREFPDPFFLTLV